jgi:hypothetical protein
MNVKRVVTASCMVIYAVFMFALHDVAVACLDTSLLGLLLQTKMDMTQNINAAFKMVIYRYRTATVMQQDV